MQIHFVKGFIRFAYCDAEHLNMKCTRLENYILHLKLLLSTALIYKENVNKIMVLVTVTNRIICLIGNKLIKNHKTLISNNYPDNRVSVIFNKDFVSQ